MRGFRKKILTSLFIALSVTSCRSESNESVASAESTNQKQSHEIVSIKYINKVNDYSVSVVWQPVKVRYDHVIGPAIVTLTHQTTQDVFTVTNNNFSVLKSLLPFKFDENEDVLATKSHIELKYEPTKSSDENGFGLTSVPFFFQDVNFDNIEDLLITEVDNGQRSLATFKVYILDEYGDIDYGTTYQEPFISLDQLSTINYKNKSISIYGSGGWCAGGSIIYKLVPSAYGQSFKVVMEDELEENAGKCYLKTYQVQVNEPQRILISTERVQ